jgi:hypothetical protein
VILRPCYSAGSSRKQTADAKRAGFSACQKKATISSLTRFFIQAILNHELNTARGADAERADPDFAGPLTLIT